MTSAPPDASEADPLGVIGKVIAEKYKIERYVAEGGFSLLYRAEHAIWRQPVAVKFLKALATASPGQRDRLLQGFLQEGALLRQLSSRTASILQAHDVGTFTTEQGDWYPYLILEWLEGLPLDAILDQEHASGAAPWSLEQIVQLLEPVARALEVVHRRGIAHRDIKPANLFVIGDPHGPDAFVKVLDFGIAKVVGDMAELEASRARTGLGLSSFTPWYGAPEQFSRTFGATGPWTDVFALALIVVEMLSGKSPLEGTDVAELAFASTRADLRPTPRCRGVLVSEAVEQVFRQAFAVKTTDRYATAGAFWLALRAAMGASQSTLVSLFADAGTTTFTLPVVVPPGPALFADGPSAALAPPTTVTTTAARAAALTTASTVPQPGTLPAVDLGTAEPAPKPARTAGRLGLMLAGGSLAALLAAGAFFGFGPGRKPLAGDPPGAPPASALASAAPAHHAPGGPSAAPPAPACPGGMAPIPGGNFYMGLDTDDARPFEKPQHSVALGGYCMDITEVTVEAYRACSDKGDCPRAAETVSWPGITPREKKIYGPLCNIDDAGRDRHPINCVDWDMADTFCKKAGKRLPTSAEWELSVRGPDGRIYPWGDEKPSANLLNACGKECVAWGAAHGEPLTPLHDEDDGFAVTAPVGSFPRGRSRYGLDDVIGNVMEWVEDWDGPYTKEAQRDPHGPATGSQRVVRGGAWNAGDPGWVRPSYRYHFAPEGRSHGIGFRCAQSLP